MTAVTNTVNIRPGVAILSVLRHLNYRPWYALAEFVDNSLQSYLSHRSELEAVEGPGQPLRVTIELDSFDGASLTIHDNAAGIYEHEFPRAFRPAEVPPDTSGLSEFGMGMKSAACWLAPRWSVRTKALGEQEERLVHFDIDQIVRDEREALSVESAPAAANAHHTEVVIQDLYHKPATRTIGKMREHLASIYRVFLREGLLELTFILNGDADPLSYELPTVLTAPYFKDENGPAKRWWKDIDFDLGNGQRVHGFAALRETASTSRAGFALFRRNRLIQGSADEAYRPEQIFGRSNSYTYQRLFGELHLEGFQVSHTKDGFQWADSEEPFLELLKEHLDNDDLPLLRQAEGYRVRPKTPEIRPMAEIVTRNTAEVIQREVPPVLEAQVGREPDTQEPPPALEATTVASERTFRVMLHGEEWEITLQLTNEPGISDWITPYGHAPAGEGGLRRVGMRVSLAHPFMVQFAGSYAYEMEPLVRLAAALGLAETAARLSGVRGAGEIRRNVNELLRPLAKQ